MSGNNFRPARRLAYGSQVLALAICFALLAAPGFTTSGQAPSTGAPQLAPMCQTNGTVWDIAQAQQAWFVAGDFTEVRPPGVPAGGPGSVARTGLAVCGPDGSPLNWAPVISHTTPANFTIQTLALDPGSNTVYFGGRFTHVNGQPRANVAAVGALSANLRMFSPNLPAGTKVNDIELTADASTAYLGGWFGAQAWTTSGAGAKVAAFAPDIKAANGSTTGIVTVLALSTDEQTLYLGGSTFARVNGQARLGAAAVDAATGLSTLSFAPVISDANPSDLYPQVYDIVPHASHVYLCGDWWTTEGVGEQDPNGRQRNMGRFDPLTGAADLTWLPWTDGGVQACDIDSEKNVLAIGGHFDKVGAMTQTVTDTAITHAVAAIDLTSGNVLDWRPGTTGGGSQLWAVRVGGSSIALGGTFSTTAAQNQEGAARFVWPTPPVATATATGTVAVTSTPSQTPEATVTPQLNAQVWLPIMKR